jgi:hypothetical protein
MFTLTVASLAGRHSNQYATLPEALTWIRRWVPDADEDEVRTKVRTEGQWRGGTTDVVVTLTG